MPRAKRIAALCLLLSSACLGVRAARLGAETLSVLYFANTAKAADYDWLSKGLADMLITDFSAAAGLTLVEREELERVLREQEFQLSGAVSAPEAAVLGRILSAQKLVYGSFIVSADMIRIDAKAVDAGTGAVAAAASAAGRPERILELERELADALLEALGRKPPAARARTASLAAAKSYYAGLELFDSGDYARAIELFKASAAADPAFAKPQKGIEASYTFLKDFRRMRQQGEMSDLAEDISLLKARLAAPRFFSFADMVADPAAFGFAGAAEASIAYQARPRVYYGDSPTMALVGLQDLYRELGDLAWEYFGDAALKDSCYAEQFSLGTLADEKYPKDPFLPEALYRQLFSLEHSRDWTGLAAACERLMLQYPKFRMGWAVEGFYERVLERMGKKP